MKKKSAGKCLPCSTKAKEMADILGLAEALMGKVNALFRRFRPVESRLERLEDAATSPISELARLGVSVSGLAQRVAALESRCLSEARRAASTCAHRWTFALEKEGYYRECLVCGNSQKAINSPLIHGTCYHSSRYHAECLNCIRWIGSDDEWMLPTS